MVVRENAQVRLTQGMSRPDHPKGAILHGRIEFVVGPEEPRPLDKFRLRGSSTRYLWRSAGQGFQWVDVTPALQLLAEISE